MLRSAVAGNRIPSLAWIAIFVLIVAVKYMTNRRFSSSVNSEVTMKPTRSFLAGSLYWGGDALASIGTGFLASELST